MGISNPLQQVQEGSVRTAVEGSARPIVVEREEHERLVGDARYREHFESLLIFTVVVVIILVGALYYLGSERHDVVVRLSPIETAQRFEQDCRHLGGFIQAFRTQQDVLELECSGADQRFQPNREGSNEHGQ